MTLLEAQILMEIHQELEKPCPNLNRVYSKWSGPTLEMFSLAFVSLKRKGLINVPEGNIIYGGDKCHPEDVILDNISITAKGKMLVEKLRKWLPQY